MKAMKNELDQLNEWRIKEGKLCRDYIFSNFLEAMEFINQVALVAEELNHHPDWSNSYNEVSIQLFTHDQNSLTEKDLELARKIDQIRQYMNQTKKLFNESAYDFFEKYADLTNYNELLNQLRYLLP